MAFVADVNKKISTRERKRGTIKENKVLCVYKKQIGNTIFTVTRVQSENATEIIAEPLMRMILRNV